MAPAHEQSPDRAAVANRQIVDKEANQSALLPGPAVDGEITPAQGNSTTTGQAIQEPGRAPDILAVDSPSPDLPVMCPKCHKQLANDKTLKRHILSHEGRTFPCQFDGCNKSFARKDTMSKHMKEVHSMQARNAKGEGGDGSSDEECPQALAVPGSRKRQRNDEPDFLVDGARLQDDMHREQKRLFLEELRLQKEIFDLKVQQQKLRMRMEVHNLWMDEEMRSDAMRELAILQAKDDKVRQDLTQEQERTRAHLARIIQMKRQQEAEIQGCVGNSCDEQDALEVQGKDM